MIMWSLKPSVGFGSPRSDVRMLPLECDHQLIDHSFVLVPSSEDEHDDMDGEELYLRSGNGVELAQELDPT